MAAPEIKLSQKIILTTEGYREAKARVGEFRRELLLTEERRERLNKRVDEAIERLKTERRITDYSSESMARFRFRIEETATELHGLNIAVLGITMSMLGLLFNLTWLTGENRELREEIRRTLSPMMVVFTTTMMLTSAYLLYVQVIRAASFWTKAFFMSAAILALVIGALSTQSRELRVALLALAGAIAAVAIAWKFKALAAVAAWTASLGPILGPIAAGVIVAAIGAAVGAVVGLLPFERGGIVRRPVIGLLGEAGPEAVIPLREFRLGQQVVFNIDRVEVRAEDPETFAIALHEHFRREKFIR